MLRTLDTVPKATRRKLPVGTTLHALLAADLVRNASGGWAVWKELVPKPESFARTQPLLWPAELQALLPKTAREIVGKQEANFRRDWDVASAAFADVDREAYLHAWLLANTRSFYFLTPRMERLPHDDRLALQPVADLFNHRAEPECVGYYSEDGYTFEALRDCDAGEELCISYGEHSNDYLLAEYGFVLDENRWDGTSLDDIILPRLSAAQRSELEAQGRLGSYMLRKDKPCCSRTYAALSLLSGQEGQSARDSQFAAPEDSESRKRLDPLLAELLREFIEKVGQTLADIQKLATVQESQVNLLTQRWKQIEKMARDTLKLARARKN